MALALVLAVTAMAAPDTRAATATIPIPDHARAADFTIEAVTGSKLDLAALRSHGPVVLDFWATWCKPCVMALPELDRLYRAHRERGLSVVAISVDGPRNFAKVRPFAAKLGLHVAVAIDRDGGLQQLYQVKACPTTFLIARDGRIAWVRQGYLPGDSVALGKAIEALLDSAAVDSIP